MAKVVPKEREPSVIHAGAVGNGDGDELARLLAQTAQLRDWVWSTTMKWALRKHGPAEGMRIVKERFLADTGVWSVVAALIATMGVSFLVTGPNNFRGDNNSTSNEALMYCYVAASAGTIVFSIGGVLVGTVTYALCSLVPDEHLIEFLLARQNLPLWGGQDHVIWVSRSVICLLGCVLFCTYLLYGPYALCVTGVITVVLYAWHRQVRTAMLGCYGSYMNAWNGDPPFVDRRSALQRVVGFLKRF